MPRNYDSSRRTEAARRTREAIVAAAFELHGRGIIDIEALAREADVSVATVRKHFPTREHLFEGCTAYGMHQVALPDLGSLALLADPVEQTREAVQQLFAVHEALLGQIWSAYKLANESPVLARVLQQAEDLARDVAEVIAGRETATAQRGFVQGLLSPLAYRALRLHGGLSADQTVAAAVQAVLAALGVERKEAAAR